MKASAGQIINQLADQPGSAEVVAVLRGVFVDSAKRAALTAMAFVLLGFSVSWLLPDTRHTDRTEDPAAESAGS